MTDLTGIPPVSTAFAGPMSLAPPPVSGQVYDDVKLLIEGLNQYAGPEGYAVVTARTKKSKKGVDRIVYIRCDRGGKAKLNSAGFGRRLHSGTRLMECPFSAVGKRNKKGGCYLEVIRNGDHNHTPTLASAHSALRRLAMTEEVQESISSLTKVGVRSTQVLTHLRLDADEENPFFTRHDIYNVKNQQRRQAFGVLSPVQALLHNLERESWFWQYEKDELDRITKLFFSRSSCRDMLKRNSEVLIMDCTYKTNRYKMPLLVITGVTALNTSFFVGFCFMEAEKTADYVWVLEQLKLLYTQLDLPDPAVILTDCERGLINALRSVFRGSSHLLCIWHIDKNVLVNCRKHFDIEEDWQTFYKAWHLVMYAKIEEEYQFQWTDLQEIYDTSHEGAVSYLRNDLLLIYKKKFVGCWTDRKLHFGNHATSRGEGSNATLKRELGSSVADLKSVVDSLKLLLMNQRHDYIAAVQMAKTRLPFRLRAPILRDLVAHMTSFALHKVIEQYNLITTTEGPLLPCTNVFTRTLSLPCAHRIQRRMDDTAGGGVLKIEDIHSHWRFEGSAVSLSVVSTEVTPEASETSDADMNDDVPTSFVSNLSDPLLQVQNPAIVRPKGRPVGARGRRGVRRQQEFEDSTQRELSQHEHVLREAEQHGLQQGVEQGRGRGRGRGLTRARGGGQRGGGQRGERAATPPSIQTDAGLFAAFHM